MPGAEILDLPGALQGVRHRPARDAHQPSRNRSSYETGLDIAARLAAADPANTDWQRDLSFVRQRIADLEASASET